MGFKMIHWTPISGSYFMKGCILEKCGNFWKNNTARADMAGLGSIGLNKKLFPVYRPGGSKRADWNFFFHLFNFYFFYFSPCTFL